MGAGKLMLTRAQLRESFIGTKVKVMPKIEYMVGRCRLTLSNPR